jgi:hypothetical protein
MPFTVAWSPRTSSSVFASALIIRRFLELQAEELRRLDGELHRQLLEHRLAEAVDDHRDRFLGADAALREIEQLVLADLRRRRLVLDGRAGVLTWMYGKVLAPHWSPISIESHCE